MRIARLVLPLLALVALAVPASASAGSFQSPSRNIGCYISKGLGARCDIRHREWKAPPKPKGCELDWGFGLVVGEVERGAMVCAGDTALGMGPVLAYGRSISEGRYTCASRRSGMRCVNRRSGHGFEISRQTYRRF